MDDAAKAGMLVDGRYRLEQHVGQGGMGSVWIAEDEKLLRWVAVKILSEKCVNSPTVSVRFEREAKALAKLRSPHVVQVFDFGKLERGAYMVMELLHGQDLHQWFAAERPCALEPLVGIVKQIARGLDAIHKAGLVHRDLKPSNVFVLEDEGPMTIKIFDFGLAKGMEDVMPSKDRTESGVLLGTPRFMSPEQAEGAGEVDSRSDLWSLGVIAYLGLTGQLPFRGRGIGEIIAKIATQPHPLPSTLVAGIVPTLDRFFAKALAKSPDERFADALSMAASFEAAATEQATGEKMVPLSLPSQVRQSSDDTLHDFDDDITYDEEIVASDAAPRLDEAGDGNLADAPRLARLDGGHRRYWVGWLAVLLVALLLWFGKRGATSVNSSSSSAPGSVVPAPPQPSLSNDRPRPSRTKSVEAGEATGSQASVPLPSSSSLPASPSASAAEKRGPTREMNRGKTKGPKKAGTVRPTPAKPTASADEDRGLKHFDDRH